MIKQYKIFAIQNAAGHFQLGSIVERSKAVVDAATIVGPELSFLATDGYKMFILGDAELLTSLGVTLGIKKSDTGIGSTCGATIVKVQELGEILISMGYKVDVDIAYAAIEKVMASPKFITQPKILKAVNAFKAFKAVGEGGESEGNEEDTDSMESYFEFSVPSSKEDMIDEALELAETIANVENDSDAFVIICEFYLKHNK